MPRERLVLVVEPNELTRKAIERSLKEAGVTNIIPTKSLREARMVFEESQPDLVVTAPMRGDWMKILTLAGQASVVLTSLYQYDEQVESLREKHPNLSFLGKGELTAKNLAKYFPKQDET